MAALSSVSFGEFPQIKQKDHHLSVIDEGALLSSQLFQGDFDPLGPPDGEKSSWLCRALLFPSRILKINVLAKESGDASLVLWYCGNFLKTGGLDRFVL